VPTAVLVLGAVGQFEVVRLSLRRLLAVSGESRGDTTLGLGVKLGPRDLARPN
jgi:hypothetical protein